MTSALLTIFSTIAVISNIPAVQSRVLPQVNKDNLYDCAKRAKEEQCLPTFEDPKTLKRSCGTTCMRWIEDTGHFTQFQLYDSEEFYELSALTASHKKEVEFDRFDGYLTIIAPVAKTCSNNDVSAKAIFESIASLKDAFKFNVDVVIFPYLHPSMNYEEEGLDCSEFEELMAVDPKKSGYFVMEETNMDATSGDIHPVFELFFKEMRKDLKRKQGDTKPYDEVEGEKRWEMAYKREEDVGEYYIVPPVYDFFFDTTDPQDLILKTQTYFVVEPDGETVYFHYDKSMVDLKDALRALSKILGELKEEL